MAEADFSTAYIGLGSNLDQPHRQIRRAIKGLDRIPGTRVVAESGLYRSKPLVPASGVIEQADFCNAVARIETRLDPLELLDQLQRIERSQGRKRTRHWGPRTIDLDILLFADLQMHGARLTLPHPGVSRRAFVLYPLRDIDDSLEIPGHGKLSELIEHCARDGLQYLGTIEGYEE